MAKIYNAAGEKSQITSKFEYQEDQYLDQKEYFDRSYMEGEVVSGTIKSGLLITPRTSETVSGISYHRGVTIGDATGTTAVGWGDPAKPSYYLHVSAGRTVAASASFTGTDTAGRFVALNKLTNNAAYNLQGLSVKAKNYTGGTVGNITGMHLEIVADGTDAANGAVGFDLSGDSSSIDEAIRIRELTAVTGIEVSATCTTGINLGAACTTGFVVGTCTTGMTIGACTSGITIGASTTGISIAAATTGIDMSSNMTTYLNIAGTLGTATGRSVKAAVVLNNGALTDGYGAAEFDLTLTGTDADHVAGLSSWVNMAAGTHGAGGKFICAQTNGIWEDAAATITDAKIIFGMRASLILGDTDAGGTYPWSINTNNKAITAVYQVNNTTDMGLVTNAGSDAGTLVPFMHDSNGNLHYIKMYILA